MIEMAWTQAISWINDNKDSNKKYVAHRVSWLHVMTSENLKVDFKYDNIKYGSWLVFGQQNV